MNMPRQLLRALITLALVSHATPLIAQTSAFTYQGQIADNGTPANGSYDLRFSLHDAISGGSSVAGPVTNSNLAVSDGLFTVVLDFGAGPFTGQSRWLEIGVRTNGIPGDFTILSPRQELTPVPYALVSANLLDGVVTSNKLAAGAVTTPKLADGSVTSAKLAPGTVITNSVIATNNLALGTTILDGRLDVYRTSVGTPAISLFGSANQISTYGDDGLEQIRLWGPTYGELWLNNNLSGNHTAVFLSALGSNGGQLSLNNSNGQTRASLFGANTGGLLNLFAANGTNTTALDGAAGQMSLFRSTDGTRSIHLFDFGGGALRLNGNNAQQRALLWGANNGGNLQLHSGGSRATMLLTGDNGSGDAMFSLSSSNEQERATLSAAGIGGRLQMFNGASFLTVDLQGQSPGGSLQLRNNVGLSAHLLSGNQGGNLRLHNSSGVLTVDVRSQFDAGNNAAWVGLNDNGLQRITFAARNGTTGAGGLIGVFNASGTPTILLTGDDGAGKSRMTTHILQITGGSDLSEQFDVEATHEAVKPGMVVCIDATNPGKLVRSTKAYDRTVAGIVSGAGGVSPGMLMGQQGSVADGKHPVALTGRVYCLGDASTVPIKPGDLLTTSETPGHAMKVADHAKAQGAIIGKAMTPLESGQGLVLVLVSLQ